MDVYILSPVHFSCRCHVFDRGPWFCTQIARVPSRDSPGYCSWTHSYPTTRRLKRSRTHWACHLDPPPPAGNCTLVQIYPQRVPVHHGSPHSEATHHHIERRKWISSFSPASWPIARSSIAGRLHCVDRMTIVAGWGSWIGSRAKNLESAAAAHRSGGCAEGEPDTG